VRRRADSEKEAPKNDVCAVRSARRRSRRSAMPSGSSSSRPRAPRRSVLEIRLEWRGGALRRNFRQSRSGSAKANVSSASPQVVVGAQGIGLLAVRRYDYLRLLDSPGRV